MNNIELAIKLGFILVLYCMAFFTILFAFYLALISIGGKRK